MSHGTPVAHSLSDPNALPNPPALRYTKMAMNKGGLKSRLKKILKYHRPKTADYLLALVTIGLTLFGLLMIYDTSVVVAFEQFNDKFWFLKNQAVWALIGVTGGFILSNINYRTWYQLSSILILITIGMLILVLIPGFSNEVYGAKQRLIIPGIPVLNSIFIQPSEVAKLTLSMYLAGLLSSTKTDKKRRKPIGNKLPHLQFFLITGIIVALIALEPDLGNAVLIMGTVFIIYFAAGVNVATLAGVTLVGFIMALLYAFSSDYRRQRIFTFLNPSRDPQGVSYQISQILIALGSGGLFGLGLGNSRQKYQYIPEVTTDSIFAIIGEELGLIGALAVIGALFFIIWRGYKIAEETEDRFGWLLAIGLTSNIAIQAFVNLAGMVGLLPLTGVPLPFISYGGTSLTLLLCSIGILLNISRNAKRHSTSN
jgi:cell division protein FtsW